jgi:poly(3-hydroxyalkanoate) depolymerase
MDAPARPARKTRALRIEHVHLGRHRIRYAVRPGDPARPPLLFLNGIGANIELALPFIEALTGPTVVIFDVPGVGGSPTPPSPYRPSGIARLAASLLDHLGYAQADVLGVSWGGAIAQQFAFQHPERCRRLVLAATSPGALMVPAQLSVLLKMVTPRRYQDSVHAHRVAGEVYGGAFRRDPALVERTFRHVRFSSKGGYYLQPLPPGLDQPAVAVPAAPAHAGDGRRSAGPAGERANPAVPILTPGSRSGVRASVPVTRRRIGARRRILPDGARDRGAIAPPPRGTVTTFHAQEKPVNHLSIARTLPPTTHHSRSRASSNTASPARPPRKSSTPARSATPTRRWPSACTASPRRSPAWASSPGPPWR